MSFWSRLMGEVEVKQDSRVPTVATAFKSDAWQNSYTGLGTSRDKVTQGSYWAPYRLQDTELLALYNGSDLAARICETKPQEMMRQGYELEVEGQAEDGEDVPDAEELADLMKYGQKLRLNDLVTDGGVWGGLFGGALLIMGIEDGGEPDQPVREASVRSVRYLNLIDRRFIFVHTYYNDPLQPNYGLPETYMVSNSVSGYSQATSTTVIHETRCIRFDGARTDILTRQQLAGWSWSVLQRAYDQLRNFEMGFQAVANLMSDASQAVFKMQNLISMIAGGNKEDLATRMALVDMSRSVARAVLIDAESEDFERKPTTFTGLPDLLDRFMMRLSAACGIPVAILMGRSAAGMNATGDSDFRAFYGQMESEQRLVLEPKLRRLYHILALAKDGPIARSLEFKMKFKPLWTSTDTEMAGVRYQTAQADQIYATIGALTPEEIKLSRWGKGPYSTETTIDPEGANGDQIDQQMFKSMLQPPPELQGRGAQGQGQQQTAVTTLPGPNGNASPQPPIGAGATPYGQSKNPVAVMGKLHEAPKPVKQDAEEGIHGGPFVEDEWNEEDHPRDETGRFSASASDASEAAHLSGSSDDHAKAAKEHRRMSQIYNAEANRQSRHAKDRAGTPAEAKHLAREAKQRAMAAEHAKLEEYHIKQAQEPKEPPQAPPAPKAPEAPPEPPKAPEAVKVETPKMVEPKVRNKNVIDKKSLGPKGVAAAKSAIDKGGFQPFINAGHVGGIRDISVRADAAKWSNADGLHDGGGWNKSMIYIRSDADFDKQADLWSTSQDAGWSMAREDNNAHGMRERTIVHELSHALHLRAGLPAETQKAITKAYEARVQDGRDNQGAHKVAIGYVATRYAKTNEKEWFAETHSMYVYHPKELAQRDPEAHALMQRVRTERGMKP